MRYAADTLTHIHTTIERLHTEWHQLDTRLRTWAADGYPAGIDGGGGNGPGHISDPTAAAVFSGDEVRRDRERAHALIIRIHNLVGELDAIRAMYLQAPKRHSPDKSYRGISKCANQFGCPDDAWAEKAGRCSACYEYRRRNDRDRNTSRTNTNRAA